MWSGSAGQRARQHCGTKLSFVTEPGWKVVVTANRRGTYYEVEQALEEVLVDVRHRINNNVQLF